MLKKTSPARPHRRSFLKTAAASVVGWPVLLGSRNAIAAPLALTETHRMAVNRRRRIVVQYDANAALGEDWNTWLDYRFSCLDEPDTQIDSVCWDIQPLLKGYYPTPAGSIIYRWPDEQTDIVARLVEETRRRDCEVFWNHRISEVDLRHDGRGAAWESGPHPFKAAHPEWTLKTWWKHGLWNLAEDGIRRHKVELLRHLARTYPLDGFQLDFARHVPCLPPGRQWELRDHATRFVRMVREMTLEEAPSLGRPILLAARIPRSPAGCRSDGLDVEAWAEQNLVDILSLGSRSIEVDVEGFRRLVGDRSIRLQPCCDDHHAPDGYRCPPIEVHRGTFSNWLRQGADSVMTFNWANADPGRLGHESAAPAVLAAYDVQLQAYREVGSLETMRGKDKTFVVERRGGYPGAEGYFNRNADAPLPMPIGPGATVRLSIRVADAVSEASESVRTVVLRSVFFHADPGDRFEIRLGGKPLPITLCDPDWKDPQVYSGRAEPPASGGQLSRYRIDPKQRLLRLECAVRPEDVALGKKEVEIVSGGQNRCDLEKLELDVRYA